MGIEPSLFAWEAKVLPLNDSRVTVIVLLDGRSFGVGRMRLRICRRCDVLGHGLGAYPVDGRARG